MGNEAEPIGMTSRQRLQAALEHKPVDKLCFDLGAGGQTGKEGWRRLFHLADANVQVFASLYPVASAVLYPEDPVGLVEHLVVVRRGYYSHTVIVAQ